MQRKTITLTPQQDEWVKAQVASGQFGNDSEYIRHLVRQDQMRQQAKAELGDILDQALASGVSESSPLDIWQAALMRHKSKC
ncbi:antitoxin ParD1/3/4 [Rheinheimera pacifica]|uniref:Antitoxin ParD n=1 Tax=Rheinheimera pacifica TaxID=173990 RepID=A0A1H6KHZ1_9GAMM|nr:type II toxin-antitoxin system ParD family antitoxin [Rheinheimera pacifica]SEH75154.1 antitoxin ParD1/3/4 [Rheinheimera pacifica]